MEQALKCITEGKNIIFTFKSEAEEFIKRNNLNAEYIEQDMIDDECYKIKGYGAKIYWIAI